VPGTDLDALAPLDGRVLRRIGGPSVARTCAGGWFAFAPGAAALQVFDPAGDVVDERSLAVGRRSHAPGACGPTATPSASPLDSTGVASGFHPARGEILFMPHDDPDIELRAWWTGEPVGRCDGSDVFGAWDEQDDLDDEPDSYGYTGAFLDGDRLVASTWSDRWLVVDRSSGAPTGRLTVDGEECDAVTIEQVTDGVLLCAGTSTFLLAVDS
jgi:hypothetical protein